jgi:hypothetical protein
MAITKVWLDDSENLPTLCGSCEAFASEHDIPQAPDHGTGTVRYGTQFTTPFDSGTQITQRTGQ